MPPPPLRFRLGLTRGVKLGDAVWTAPKFHAPPVALILGPDHCLGVALALKLGGLKNVAVIIHEIEPVTEQR